MRRSSRRSGEGTAAARLARPPAEISVADVVRAVDGPLANVRGARPELVTYEGRAAPLGDVWVALRVNMRRVLEAVTLEHLVQGKLPRSSRPCWSRPGGEALAPGSGPLRARSAAVRADLQPADLRRRNVLAEVHRDDRGAVRGLRRHVVEDARDELLLVQRQLADATRNRPERLDDRPGPSVRRGSAPGGGAWHPAGPRCAWSTFCRAGARRHARRRRRPRGPVAPPSR